MTLIKELERGVKQVFLVELTHDDLAEIGWVPIGGQLETPSMTTFRVDGHKIFACRDDLNPLVTVLAVAPSTSYDVAIAAMKFETQGILSVFDRFGCGDKPHAVWGRLVLVLPSEVPAPAGVS